MNIANKIQTLRKQHNLTQEYLADQLNVSRQALSKWELGISTPEADKIVQISDYFKVSTDYLLKDTISFESPSEKKLSSRSIIILSTAMILMGLTLMIAVWELAYLGFIVQIIGVATLELLVNRQHKTAQKFIHSVFYGINLWFILFVPYILFYQRIYKYILFFIPFKNELTQSLFMFGSYTALCVMANFVIYVIYKKK